MALLLDALASGRIFIVVAALLIIEAALLAALGSRKGLGLSIAEWLPMLVAGLGLALAGVCISVEADPRLVGASLVLALAGHVEDLRRRARQRRAG